MAKELIFEKVGDINSTYPYLCIYLEDESEPFMEIAVTDKKELLFTIYPQKTSVLLNISQWHTVFEKANEFLPEVLADEASF